MCCLGTAEGPGRPAVQCLQQGMLGMAAQVLEALQGGVYSVDVGVEGLAELMFIARSAGCPHDYPT